MGAVNPKNGEMLKYLLDIAGEKRLHPLDILRASLICIKVGWVEGLDVLLSSELTEIFYDYSSLLRAASAFCRDERKHRKMFEFLLGNHLIDVNGVFNFDPVPPKLFELRELLEEFGMESEFFQLTPLDIEIMHDNALAVEILLSRKGRSSLPSVPMISPDSYEGSKKHKSSKSKLQAVTGSIKTLPGKILKHDKGKGKARAENDKGKDAETKRMHLSSYSKLKSGAYLIEGLKCPHRLYVLPSGRTLVFKAS